MWPQGSDEVILFSICIYNDNLLLCVSVYVGDSELIRFRLESECAFAIQDIRYPTDYV